MELRQLATFRTVATTLSFTRAAGLLGYVQSSVTAQIQALEEELGVALFDRLGKRVTLTEPGRRLLRYAERMLALAEEARAAVTGDDDPAGTVTISAYESLCTYRLPSVLLRLRERHPRVRLLLKPSPWADLRQGVQEGTLDAAFVLEEQILPAGLVGETLVREPLLVVARPDHPLARAQRVTPADLAGENALLTEVGCSYRLRFERSLAAAGVHLGTALEFSSVEAIKQCVMAGMGVAVLPEITVRSEIAQGRLAALAWSEPGYTIATQLIYHKEKWISPALAAFLDTAREALGGVGDDIVVSTAEIRAAS